MRYLPLTPTDRRDMLAVIAKSSGGRCLWPTAGDDPAAEANRA